MSEAKKRTHQSSYYHYCPLPNQEAEAGAVTASVPLPSNTNVPNSPTPYPIGLHITTRSKAREARRKTQSTSYYYCLSPELFLPTSLRFSGSKTFWTRQGYKPNHPQDT